MTQPYIQSDNTRILRHDLRNSISVLGLNMDLVARTAAPEMSHAITQLQQELSQVMTGAQTLVSTTQPNLSEENLVDNCFDCIHNSINAIMRQSPQALHKRLRYIEIEAAFLSSVIAVYHSTTSV